MNKKFVFRLIVKTITLFLILWGSNSYGQENLLKNSNNSFPKESIFIHYNDTFFLTGEYLYFSVYCLDQQGKTLSKLSKIAYVELLNQDGVTIFKQKLKLENGQGSGDFFIPTNTPSGSCKLLGYTQFMRNGDEKDIFQADLIILNPYTNNQSVFVDNKNEVIPIIPKKTSSFPTQLTAELNKEEFSKREKVELKLNNPRELKNGSISISVSKKLGMDYPKRTTSADYSEEESKRITNLKEITFLPELRGEIISGRAVSKSTGKPLQLETIVVSIPDEEYFLFTTKTDEKGQFFVNLNSNYSGNTAYFQALESNEELEIVINEHDSIPKDNYSFQKFHLESAMENAIIERSVHNQIENNYYSLKPDSIKTKLKKSFFDETKTEKYVLDEYTRFNTFRETVVEILRGVSIRNREGESRLLIDDYSTNKVQSGLSPLVIVDGYFIADHEVLLEYDARKIKNINVLPQKYIIGSQAFQGILDIETFENNYIEFIKPQESNSYTLFKPLPRKYYYNQIYTDDAQISRLPDFRNQLFWTPQFDISQNSHTIEFYSSDVVGEFEISIEGFKSNGDPISLVKSFRVRE